MKLGRIASYAAIIGITTLSFSACTVTFDTGSSHHASSVPAAPISPDSGTPSVAPAPPAPSSAAPSQPGQVDTVTSAWQVVDALFDNGNCTWKTTSASAPQILESDDCGIMVIYSTYPGFASGLYKEVKAKGTNKGQFFVDEDNWAVVTEYSPDADEVVANYGGKEEIL